VILKPSDRSVLCDKGDLKRRIKQRSLECLPYAFQEPANDRRVRIRHLRIALRGEAVSI